VAMQLVNWSMVKEPLNWGLVLFSLIIIGFVCHLALRNNVEVYGAHA
jgi:hypothetical protein